MKLTDHFEDVITFGDRRIKLRLYFDVVLRSFELLKDNRFSGPEKTIILVDMFVENKESVAGLRFRDKAILVDAIFSKFISPDEGQKSSEKPQYDLQKDAEYIYASFLFDYKIDLFEQHGKLHWNKFKALLANLSDESKFMKVIGYRTAEIPPIDNHNRKEVERLRKLKRLFALENTETVEDIDRKFNDLAAMLRPWGGK